MQGSVGAVSHHPVPQSALTRSSLVSFRRLHLFQKACSLVFCLSCPLFQGLGLDRLRFCLWEGESKVAPLARMMFRLEAGQELQMRKGNACRCMTSLHTGPRMLTHAA